jgi:hypothetical protein
VELTALPAGIDPVGKVGDQVCVELPADELRRELCGVDAGEHRPDACADHLGRQLASRPAPQGEAGRHPRAGQRALPVRPHVGEEEVAEDQAVDTILGGGGHGGGHPRLVHLVGTR